MGKLKNTFSWSFSAAEHFSQCRRRRYWSKYGMWGGWAQNVMPEEKTVCRADTYQEHMKRSEIDKMAEEPHDPFHYLVLLNFAASCFLVEWEWDALHPKGANLNRLHSHPVLPMRR